MEDWRLNSTARLLVVEDEPLVAEDLRLRLEELQYTVAGLAADGRQAIELADTLNPDLVLMDIVLGGDIDGIQAAEEIRSRFGIPVIFVTAYTDKEFLERARSIEPFGYIVKPVRTHDLHAVVSMALYRNTLEQQLAGLRWGAGVCDHLSDAIIAVDRDQRIAYVNDSARRLLNGDCGVEAGGHWDHRCLVADTGKPFKIDAHVREVFDTGQRKLFDQDLELDADSRKITVRLQLVPISTKRRTALGVAIVLHDVTEQRTSKAALLRTETALRRLHDITSDQEMGFEQKIHRLLEMGAEQFSFPVAILSRVEGDDYHVVDAVSPDGTPQPGVLLALGETYCRNTLAARGPLGFTDAEHSEWRSHPAYLKCHMEAYLGIPVRVAGKVYGTLNFSSPEARPTPFNNDDFEILKLMSQWLGSELERQATYQVLETERRRVATLAQVSPQGIFRTDPEGICNYVNTRWCEITGLPAEQALGASWTRFLNSAETQTVARQWRDAGDYRMNFNRQCRFERDSKACWVLVKMAAEYDEDGKILGYVGSLSDITDLKETQEALLEREQAYSDLLANLTGMAYRCRNDHDWTMVYVSEGCKKLTGWSSEDLTNNRNAAFNDLIHPDDRGPLWEACQKSLEKHRPCSNEYRIVTRAGEIRWVWDQSNGRYDSNGELVEIEGYISDITDKKLMADKLARHKAEFEAMFNAIPDAIVFAAVDRKIHMVNPAVQELFGYSEGELVGRTTEVLYADPEAYRIQGEQRFNVKLMPNPAPYEMSYKRKDGSEFVGETIGVPIFGFDGTPIGMLGVIRDITKRKQIAEETRLALNHLQALYDASPDMVFMHDASGRLVDVNDNVLKVYGYSRDELLSLDIGALSGAGYSQHMSEEAIRRAMRGDPVDIEWVAKRKDGQEFPVEVRLRRLEGLGNDSGAPVVAVVRDLSEHMESEKRLKHESDFSTAVLDTIGSVVVVLNRDGEIVRFNMAAQRLTGYTEPQVMGRHVWDFLLPPEEAAGVAAVFRKLTAGEFPNTYENSWLTKAGETRVLAWSNSALVDAEGRVEYIIASGIDITEQRRAERDLVKVETQWSEVIDFLTDPVYLVDLDDKVMQANRAFYQMTGKSPEDIIGESIVSIMHPDGEIEPCPVCQARVARKDTTVVMEADDPVNPLKRPVEVGLRIIRDPHDKPQGILMVLRDLTQQRGIEAELRQHRDNLESLVQQRTAALENANRELEAFSYSVSHDLRAPLRGIDGFSQALLEEYSDKIDEVGQDYLHRVRRASQRLGVLIDDLLELSRVGRNRIEYKWVDLSKIVATVLKDLKENEPDQALSADIQPQLQACGDPVLLRLMVQNLIGNAWKFSSVRTVSEIRFGVEEQSDGNKVFFVSDNGVGFDMTYADKLFGAFQRLHSGQEFEGTGVGLATVQRIIHRHEGEIWAKSSVNGGATFFFTLPDVHCQ